MSRASRICLNTSVAERWVGEADRREPVKKFIVAMSSAVASLGISLALSPAATAGPACRAMTPEENIQSQTAGWTPQQYIDWGNAQNCGANVADLPSDLQRQPLPSPPVPEPVAASSPAGGPNCTEYGKKYDGMPAGVDNALDVLGLIPGAPEVVSGAGVLTACSVANSAIAGVAAVTGNNNEAAEAARQATIGQCLAGQQFIPFVQIPGKCE